MPAFAISSAAYGTTALSPFWRCRNAGSLRRKRTDVGNPAH